MDSNHCHSDPPSHAFPTREITRGEAAADAAIGHVGGGYDPYSVSISSIINIVWLLRSLTFDPPLLYNLQHFPSVGDQQPPSKPDRDWGSQRNRRKQRAVSPRNRGQDPPTAATKAMSHNSGIRDLNDPFGFWRSKPSISPPPGPPSRITAHANNKPSQDSINTLDKGGHLRHSYQDQG